MAGISDMYGSKAGGSGINALASQLAESSRKEREEREERERRAREEDSSFIRSIWDMRPRLVEAAAASIAGKARAIEAGAYRAADKAYAMQHKANASSLFIARGDAKGPDADFVRESCGNSRGLRCRTVSGVDGHGSFSVPIMVPEFDDKCMNGLDAQVEVEASALTQAAYFMQKATTEGRELTGQEAAHVRDCMRAIDAAEYGDPAQMRDNLVTLMLATQRAGIDGLTPEPPKTPAEMAKVVEQTMRATNVLTGPEQKEFDARPFRCNDRMRQYAVVMDEVPERKPGISDVRDVKADIETGHEPRARHMTRKSLVRDDAPRQPAKGEAPAKGGLSGLAVAAERQTPTAEASAIASSLVSGRETTSKGADAPAFTIPVASETTSKNADAPAFTIPVATEAPDVSVTTADDTLDASVPPVTPITPVHGASAMPDAAYDPMPDSVYDSWAADYEPPVDYMAQPDVDAVYEDPQAPGDGTSTPDGTTDETPEAGNDGELAPEPEDDEPEEAEGKGAIDVQIL